MSRGGRYLVLWLRLFYGAHLLYSSLRYFTVFEPQPVIPGLGGSFIGVLTDMHLFTPIKALEGVVGTCLILNLFVPLVLAMEVPVSVNIFVLNFFIVGTPRQLFTGPQEIFLNGILMIMYWGSYRSMLTWRPAPTPPWSPGEGRRP